MLKTKSRNILNLERNAKNHGLLIVGQNRQSLIWLISVDIKNEDSFIYEKNKNPLDWPLTLLCLLSKPQTEVSVKILRLCDESSAWQNNIKTAGQSRADGGRVTSTWARAGCPQQIYYTHVMWSVQTQGWGPKTRLNDAGKTEWYAANIISYTC